ncbi:MAG: GAF domain-containing protein [Candidatus Bipolaricaulota bacterium]
MKVTDFSRVRDEIMGRLDSDSLPGDKLLEVVKLLREEVDHYDWVGFYVASPEDRELSLGPFSGAPTEHTEIVYGEGICGQAAERESTFIVDDVSDENNYLSCSPEVESEIVLPIFSNGDLVGELDIDSHQRGAFTDRDEEFLREVARLVSRLL